MSTLARDIRYAIRQLRKSPGFTILVLGTLALGIGASTAMFGVMNAILLRPLPFRDSDRLVRVLSAQSGTVRGPSPLNFSDSDTESSQPVALINLAFANTYFPGEDPLGKQIQLGLPQPMVSSNAPNLRLTVIGVIGDTMNRGLALPPLPQLTALFRQTPDLNYGFKNLMVRTALDPMQLAPSIRRQLHFLDANLPFAEVSSMDEIMQQQTSDRRYTTALLILFAVFGLGLAAMGVYGVVSYVVIQRTSEIGLRMALGARRPEILWLVLKQGLGMAAVGTAVGLASAWILRKTVAELVFGISPADPVTFVAAALVLMGFAVFASLLPARRATKVDPMVALRYE